MRHTRIRKKALLIDKLVDVFNNARSRRAFPHKAVQNIIPLLFPDARPLGKGFFKTVFKISSTVRDLALKTANSKYIRRDFRLYMRLPRSTRNRYFAKTYWATKYCLLQKYGKEREVPPRILKKLRRVGVKYHLSDIREDNVRFVDGRFRIVDANPERRA